MSTLGSLALTLADYRKRMAPDGSLDYIVETASQSNPVMKEAVSFLLRPSALLIRA